MDLRTIVAKYVAAAGGYGRPVPLASFGLSQQDTEGVFSMYDEDYHISRYIHFSNVVGAPYYHINGFAQTHVSLDEGIRKIL